MTSWTQRMWSDAELAEETGERLGPAEERRAGAHFAVTARYEWMFWDAAWRTESWPDFSADR